MTQAARPIVCRGVRGAIVVDANERDEILRRTRQVLALMIRANGVDPRDVASAWFTTTPDLTAEFPAIAARQLGWGSVPILCGHEMLVPGALQRVVRILVHWNTTREQADIQHVYVRGAEALRPDRLTLPPVDWDDLERWIVQAAAGYGFRV
jgi:chorismate mutase